LKPQAFDYVAPKTVEGAIDALAGGGEEARVLAGGQSLVPMMNLRLATPGLLVDLNGVASLAGIDGRPDGSVRIGAMTRHAQVATSETVRRRLPLLAAAMPYIAHAQIRNRGTIGGSLAHADPAAEWPALCVALGAGIVARGKAGERVVSADDFFQGIMSTALAPDEIVTEVRFPAAAGRRPWGFQEVARRRGDFAMAGIACTVELAGDGTVTAARIVAFGVADAPVLVAAASDVIVGRRLDAAIMRQAGQAAAAIETRGDIHASAEYRTQLIEVLVARAVAQAAEGHLLEDAA
jgi:carbon-monoxide dehydrogenase medium subunit